MKLRRRAQPAVPAGPGLKVPTIDELAEELKGLKEEVDLARIHLLAWPDPMQLNQNPILWGTLMTLSSATGTLDRISFELSLLGENFQRKFR